MLPTLRAQRKNSRASTGMRVRLPIGQRYQDMLVIDRDIASDQGLKKVYIVDAENKV